MSSCFSLRSYKLNGNHRPTETRDYPDSPSPRFEEVDFYGNTGLLKACYLGNFEAVNILLSINANIHAINYFGQNALTLATYAGSFEIVCELLKYRSYIDFTLSSMIPPICVAVLRGHQHLVDFFESMHPESKTTRSVHGLTVRELQNMQESIPKEKV